MQFSKIYMNIFCSRANSISLLVCRLTANAMKGVRKIIQKIKIKNHIWTVAISAGALPIARAHWVRLARARWDGLEESLIRVLLVQNIS